MNRIFPILIFSMLLLSVTSSGKTKIKLFNGNDLTGWYAYEPGQGRYENPLELFAVDHHLIRLFGSKPGYLMTKQLFSDFELSVQFRWNTDTSAYEHKSNFRNSGVMYLIPESATDELWPKGYQFQIKEGGTGDFILLQNVSLNVNGVVVEPGKSVTAIRFSDAEKPVGRWNKLVIISNRNKITHVLNGKIVNEGVNPTEHKGRILLQYEGFPIDFRNVEIKLKH